MPVHYDKQSGSWYVKCYYENWRGEKHQRKKRGFKLQREAKEWERNFFESQRTDLGITFEAFVSLYTEDMKHRLREVTFYHKQCIINKKLLPFFGRLPLSDIKPAHVRKWQNELITYQTENGHVYSETYVKNINNQLSAIFNYAVRYYGLKENPCTKAGSIGKSHAEEMNFWTTEEFKIFLHNISDKPRSRLGFQILYYTGVRIGELLALEYEDINLVSCNIVINKSYQRLYGQDIITLPKTPKSIRTISIPLFLRDEIKSYFFEHSLHKHDRIFPCTKAYFLHEMVRGTKDGSVKKIRLHDLRHSHASLLIDLGFAPLLIADRLGHEKVETTLNTYSHLFPQKRDEVADRLQNLF